MSSRLRIRVLLIGAPLLLLTYWIASHTDWADTTLPMPPRGEAATNPSYAAQRVVEALGGHASRDRAFTAPGVDAVIVLSTWNWNLSASRRDGLQRWVEAGGRLVVDGTVNGGPEFERWSGIARVDHDRENVPRPAAGREPPCVRFDEERRGEATRALTRAHRLCDVNVATYLDTTRPIDWALVEGRVSRQAVRVAVGHGSVTVINADPFRYRQVLEADHAWLLAAAAQLQRGDEVHFLSEGDYPSLMTLIWENGGPVVVLALTVLGLLLWRGGVRIGPLAPADLPVRRSLAEQIRGTGRFALQHDAGDPLRAAAVRALDEAARRHVTAYNTLSPRDRVRALAATSGVAPEALEAAIRDSRVRPPHELRETIALLEIVRRATLDRQTRTQHGHK